MTTAALFALAESHGYLIIGTPTNGKIDSISIVLPSGVCAIMVNKNGISNKDFRNHAGHEVGHCERGAFYTKLSAPTTREKCEEAANRWQYEHMVPVGDLTDALRAGMRLWELSDKFCLPEQTVLAAYNYYKVRGLINYGIEESTGNPG